MWVAGVDGCPDGWVVVFRSLDGNGHRGRVVGSFEDIFAADERPLRIAVDIPIGLPKVSQRGGRAADRAARAFLAAGRRSSVFPAPSRAALSAADFAEACDIESLNSQPPKKVSQQVFHILPKIREVDDFVRRVPGLVFECHPEVTFAAMNGGASMRHPKKVSRRKNPDGLDGNGLDERRRLLAANGFPDAMLNVRIAPRCGWDDQLDACAAAWTAERICRGQAQRFPENSDLDETGLDMAIWA